MSAHRAAQSPAERAFRELAIASKRARASIERHEESIRNGNSPNADPAPLDMAVRARDWLPHAQRRKALLQKAHDDLLNDRISARKALAIAQEA